MTVQFMVPCLPKSVIIANRRSEANPEGQARNKEQSRFQSEVVLAIVRTWNTEMPTFEKVSISIHYRQRVPRPQDGHYRVKDAVWELGASIMMAVCRGCVVAGMFENEAVMFVAAGVEVVDAKEYEGVFVTIQDLS